MSNSERDPTTTRSASASANADRLSDLPEGVQHRILSFLPTLEVIRMSLVSKHFRNIWLHIPVLNLQQYRTEQIAFEDFVENCLSRRIQVPAHEYVNNITKFTLEIGYGHDPSTIDYWLRCVLEMGVKELVLSIEPRCPYKDYYEYDKYYICYCLPGSLLNNNNAASLTLLTLKNVGLVSCFHISLPSLKSLSLIDVFLEEEDYEKKALRNLLSGCPNIEYLDWRSPTEFWVYKDHMSDIDLTVCGAIKILSLNSSTFTVKWLEDIVSGLALLESLTLHIRNGFEQLTIRSQSLKSFCFIGGDIEATLFTPNLVYFSYEGYVRSIFSLSSSNLLEEAVVKLVKYDNDRSWYDNDRSWYDYDRLWYLDLLLLLSNLNCCNTMKLYVPSEEALLFSKHMRKICNSILPDLKHLKVKINNDFSRHTELMEALSRFAPSVQTLEIKQQSYLEKHKHTTVL